MNHNDGNTHKPGFVESSFGFRSIIPKSRKERADVKDKVALEKSRINVRVGFSARMHQKNAPATSAMLTQFEKGGAGYISNSDRFHTDTAGEELQVTLHTLHTYTHVHTRPLLYCRTLMTPRIDGHR